jgi:hypothetical protein
MLATADIWSLSFDADGRGEDLSIASLVLLSSDNSQNFLPKVSGVCIKTNTVEICISFWTLYSEDFGF